VEKKEEASPQAQDEKLQQLQTQNLRSLQQEVRDAFHPQRHPQPRALHLLSEGSRYTKSGAEANTTQVQKITPLEQVQQTGQLLRVVSDGSSPAQVKLVLASKDDLEKAKQLKGKAQQNQLLEAKLAAETTQKEQVLSYMKTAGTKLRMRTKELEDAKENEEHELQEVRRRLNYTGDIKNIMAEAKNYRDTWRAQAEARREMQQDRLNLTNEHKKIMKEHEEISEEIAFSEQAKVEVKREAQAFAEEKEKVEKDLEAKKLAVQAQKAEIEKLRESIKPVLAEKKAAEKAVEDEKTKLAEAKATSEEEMKIVEAQKAAKVSELDNVSHQEQEIDRQVQVLRKLKDNLLHNASAEKAEAKKAMDDRKEMQIALNAAEKKFNAVTKEINAKLSLEHGLKTRLESVRQEADAEELRLENERQRNLAKEEQMQRTSRPPVLRGTVKKANDKIKAHRAWVSLLESEAQTESIFADPKLNEKQVQDWCLQLGKLPEADFDAVKKEKETAEVFAKASQDASKKHDSLKQQVYTQQAAEKDAIQDVVELQELVNKAQHAETLVAKLLSSNEALKDAPSVDVVAAHKELLEKSQALLKSRKVTLKARGDARSDVEHNVNLAEAEAGSAQATATRSEDTLRATTEHLEKMQAACIVMGYLKA